MQTAAERFWSKVDKSGDCWLWTGTQNRQGYGVLTVDGRSVLAHRFALELLLEGLTSSVHAHHRCEAKLCVNPAHLKLMTRVEHAREHNPPQKVCRRGHPLTPENTHVRSDGSRYCLRCDAASKARRRREVPGWREREKARDREYQARRRAERKVAA